MLRWKITILCFAYDKKIFLYILSYSKVKFDIFVFISVTRLSNWSASIQTEFAI